MNTQHTCLRLSSVALTAVLLTALVGCTDRNKPADPVPAPESTIKDKAADAWDKTKEVAKDSYDSVKDATTSAAGKLERATYDERMEIKAGLAEASAKLDAKMAEWNKDGKTVSSATKDRVAKAKEDFKDSLDALGDATSAGWDAAKAKTAAAWENLKAAYDDAKSE